MPATCGCACKSPGNAALTRQCGRGVQIVTYTAVGYVPYEFERYIVTGKTAPELWNRLAVAKANQWAANLKRARRFIGA